MGQQDGQPTMPLQALIPLSQASVLCWLATANEQGVPNVSPKEVWAVFDAQHLVIAHIASPVSVSNIERNPQACVSFVDIWVQKGFKVTGAARIVPRSVPQFAHWSAPLTQQVGDRFPLHAVIVVQATTVQPIVAPSYALYPAQTSEASQREAAWRRYGVSPLTPDTTQ